MNIQQIADVIYELLSANKVKIRSEPLGGTGGGLCVVKDEYLFFIDTQATTTDNAVKAARALVEVTDIENIYMLPEIRDFIHRQTGIDEEF